MKIASYKYIGSDSPVLGLILEDINPDSILRDEESINLYTYTTMCVAAIQVQSKEIKKLKDEIEELKSNNQGQVSSPSLKPSLINLLAFLGVGA